MKFFKDHNKIVKFRELIERFDSDDIYCAWDMLRARNDSLACMSVYTFKPGDKVKFQTRNRGMITGVVIKRLQKKYCHDCSDKGLILDFTQVIDKLFQIYNLCGIGNPYIPKCQNKKPCSIHKLLKCFRYNCKRRVVKLCGNTTSFGVCGIPECKNHNHHK